MAELIDVAPIALLITIAFFLGFRGFGTNWTRRRDKVEREMGQDESEKDE